MTNKKRKDTFGNGLIAFLFVCMIFLMGYAFKNPILLYSTNPEVEINHEYDPKTNIQQVFYHSDSSVQVSSDIDTKRVGNYTVTYQIKDYKKTCTVSVKDTKAPKLKVKTYTTDLKEDVKPNSFVESVEDDSKVTLSFKNKVTKDEKQTVTIIAKDAYGNCTMKDTTLTLKKDTEKPVISTDPIHVYTDSKPNYKSYIEVTDNLDLNPKIKIDSSKVKTKKEGTYKLTVTATDRSGNKAKKKISVVVEEPTKVVYLTFDDGPSENTDKVLKILKKYDAKATFFVTGNNQKYNDSIRKAEKQGNTIALHTYTHDYATVYSSTEAYFNDLQQISDMVKQITGKAPKYIRSLVVQAIWFLPTTLRVLCQNLIVWYMKEVMNILTGTAQVGMPHQTAYLLKQSSITQRIVTMIKLCCCSTTQVLKLLQLKLCQPSLKTIKVVVMYLKRSVMIHPYSIMESITKSAICWLFLYKKIEGINPRLLLCSTLIDLASIQYFLQPDLHSSQQLLCSYVKV